MRLSIFHCRLSNGSPRRRGLRSRDRKGAVTRMQAAVGILVLSFVVSGCGCRSEKPESAMAAVGVTRTMHDGPVTLTVTAKPA